jgi:hypothetical protein
VPISQIHRSSINKDNGQQVCNTLISFYKVSRKRFINVVYQQVVSYYLLEGNKSPLRALDPNLILNLDDKQLKEIAGEDIESKNQRHILVRQTESLKAALKVPRSSFKTAIQSILGMYSISYNHHPGLFGDQNNWLAVKFTHNIFYITGQIEYLNTFAARKSRKRNVINVA